MNIKPTDIKLDNAYHIKWKNNNGSFFDVLTTCTKIDKNISFTDFYINDYDIDSDLINDPEWDVDIGDIENTKYYTIKHLGTFEEVKQKLPEYFLWNTSWI